MAGKKKGGGKKAAANMFKGFKGAGSKPGKAGGLKSGRTSSGPKYRSGK